MANVASSSIGPLQERAPGTIEVSQSGVCSVLFSIKDSLLGSYNGSNDLHLLSSNLVNTPPKVGHFYLNLYVFITLLICT